MSVEPQFPLSNSCQENGIYAFAAQSGMCKPVFSESIPCMNGIKSEKLNVDLDLRNILLFRANGVNLKGLCSDGKVARMRRNSLAARSTDTRFQQVRQFLQNRS